VTSRSLSPVLADVADTLSDQFRAQLLEFAQHLRAESRGLEREFLARQKKLGLDPRQRTALAAVTPGAAIQLLSKGRELDAFLEQVEYNGRRLAKLTLTPNDVVEALADYDRLLTPLIEKRYPNEQGNFDWVREQLHFCVILTLNRAYSQVREREAEAFYEMFRAELEARNVDELVRSSLEVLTRFSGAQESHLFLMDGERNSWVWRATARSTGRRGSPSRSRLAPVAMQASRRRQLGKPRSVKTSGRSRQILLDPSWERRFVSVWSVPLVTGGRIAGVMQFGFRKDYDWLPREQELLEAAAERCVEAAEKARLVEDLAAREEQLRRLSEEMLYLEEVERRRISRELHDEAGQSLLYIRLQLEMLEREIPEGLAEWKRKLGEIREITEHTILETRRLIAALSPAVLDQLGLAAALRQLASRLRQHHPCQVRLNISRLDGLPKRLETIAYRLVQECCQNIAKHSQASTVNISVFSADGILRLNVEDDGVGFRAVDALRQRNSFGLAGMRERVALLGGTLEIESEVARNGDKPKGRRSRPGTRIAVELPIPQRK